MANKIAFDALLGRLKQNIVNTGAGTGTVTTVSVASANGLAGTVANATTTPAITLSTTVTGVLKGNGTTISAATGADLPTMTATVGGAVPTPPNNTTTFLRGDGTFATPSGGGDVTASANLTDNTIILGDGGVKGIKTSSKTIVTTLGTDDTTLPTSKAVKDVTDGKVAGNIAITGATKTKITYDSKGLVTAGADATTADIADSLNKRYVTDANLTTIGNQSGTNTGDETNATIKTKLGAANTSTDGYLTSTDWNTFNGKQPQINGTGFVKASGTTISYDNSTYTPTSRTLTINGTGYDLSSDRSWTISAAAPFYESSVNGQIYTGTIAQFVVTSTQTIAGVYASLLSLPTGSNVTIQVYKNGLSSTNSIFTSDTPLSITTSTGATNGVYSVLDTAIDNGSVVAGDVIYIVVTAVGSTLPGSNLYIKCY